MAKASKLYEDSPKMERDEDGKMGVKKKSKTEKETPATSDVGTDGSNAEMGEPVTKTPEQHEEHKAMHKRHQEEQKAMHERHESDMKDMHKRHEKASKPEEKKESK